MRRCAAYGAAKKLTDVAKEWAAGDSAKDEELENDFKFFGGHCETEEKTTFVHPDNWQAFLAFTDVQTQWQLDSQDKRYALDYQRAQVAWKMLGYTLTAADFSKIQTLEKYSRESV